MTSAEVPSGNDIVTKSPGASRARMSEADDTVKTSTTANVNLRIT
jgi:hypothetical protein